MSENGGPGWPGAALQKHEERRPRKTDDRIRRTRGRLGVPRSIFTIATRMIGFCPGASHPKTTAPRTRIV